MVLICPALHHLPLGLIHGKIHPIQRRTPLCGTGTQRELLHEIRVRTVEKYLSEQILYFLRQDGKIRCTHGAGLAGDRLHIDAGSRENVHVRTGQNGRGAVGAQAALGKGVIAVHQQLEDQHRQREAVGFFCESGLGAAQVAHHLQLGGQYLGSTYHTGKMLLRIRIVHIIGVAVDHHDQMVSGVYHHVGRVQIARNDAAAVQRSNVDRQVVGHLCHGAPGPVREHLCTGVVVDTVQHIPGVDPGHNVTHHPALLKQDILRPCKAPAALIARIEFQLQHSLQLALLVSTVMGCLDVAVLVVELCNKGAVPLQGIDASLAAGTAVQRSVQMIVPFLAVQDAAAVIRGQCHLGSFLSFWILRILSHRLLMLSGGGDAFFPKKHGKILANPVIGTS